MKAKLKCYKLLLEKRGSYALIHANISLRLEDFFKCGKPNDSVTDVSPLPLWLGTLGSCLVPRLSI